MAYHCRGVFLHDPLASLGCWLCICFHLSGVLRHGAIRGVIPSEVVLYSVVHTWELWAIACLAAVEDFTYCIVFVVISWQLQHFWFYQWPWVRLLSGFAWPLFFGSWFAESPVIGAHCAIASNSRCSVWPPPIADCWIIVWLALLIQLSNVITSANRYSVFIVTLRAEWCINWLFLYSFS